MSRSEVFRPVSLGVGSQPSSPAHNDAVQALLTEMDGMIQQGSGTNGDGSTQPAHVLWVGLTNRPDMLDDALKRPGRFGLSIEIPNTTKDGAEGILAVHARGDSVPWYVGGAPRTGLGEDEVRAQFLRPAVARVFDQVVLRCQTDNRQHVDVTAGEVLSGAHYEAAINGAKRLAALRALCEEGVPAIGFEDVLASLADQAISAAKQMQADRQMLVRQLQITARITRVDAVSREELDAQEYTRN